MAVLRALAILLLITQSVGAQQPSGAAGSSTQAASSPKSHERELDTVLMQSTFKLQSIALPGQSPILGAAFVMGRPFLKPPPNQPNMARYVLITASHVLEGMPGEVAILNLRRKSDQGEWERLPFPLQIRSQNQPLWVKHPLADVAVMYIRLPIGVSIPLVSTDALADDAALEKFEIHPGDTLQCLGFPFGEESNAAGFPILRSGRIASYPLVPTAKTRTFLFDINVFQGNSGGPVYMVDENRAYQGNAYIGSTTQMIVGLVIQETTHNEQLIGQYNAEVHRYPLGLATVVHASFIKEAMNLLPAPDDDPSR